MKKVIDLDIFLNLSIILLCFIGLFKLIYYVHVQVILEREIYINNHDNLVVYDNCKLIEDKYYCYKGE